MPDLIMNVIEITSFGAPNVLRAAVRPMPVAGAGELLIRVNASGVNRPDVLQRTGNYPVPPGASDLPGLEVAWMNRPQNTVAGDYYDVFRRETKGGSRVLLVVADVAGKSIPAALLMATFQASLNTLCATPCTLAELAVGLNRYSCAHSKGGQRFTTAFLAEFNPASGELEYINAGHNPPLLREIRRALESSDRYNPINR